MGKNNRWLAIVNLLSGSGKCGRDWEHIARILYSKGIDFDTVFTGRRQHAIELAQRGIIEDGYRNIIAIGGDGTIHEVANGILTQTEVNPAEVRMGVIAVGTGNDWIRTYGIPRSYEGAAEVIAAGKEFLQDVGKATYINRKGVEESRYCVNVSGAGMDAAVNLKVCQMKDKGKNGKSSYTMQLARSVFGYRSCPMTVKVDGKQVASGMIMSVSVGIGQYNGSGMLQLPLSKADDGLLDCTIIDTMSALKIATVVGKLYDGKIYSVGKVHHHTGKCIEITAEDVREVEVDGEALGTTPVRFDISSKRLKVLVP
ncbi:MAG: diacylglycerol kinase family lipid kinase [Tidjanibacter sp.]|jgi:YegS/Rv2252/BmrU family lipid kinase|nr:diacylglycerol kinase family lipid kinase [Tidjanibacter sp.]MBQ5807709.1 diacylglycerol kinase family lipid kinase [Tidjanibacter sp.]MBQ5931987.1 diacylglycerol kinase family lipid kinase [Tidjanibacter sp.]